ncbi:MAG: TonB-dependent receptor [Gammaproteobacteria bacterium]|nr:MAG: TonB-dependent receptor [Gammaproteobacteria bacterium]
MRAISSQPISESPIESRGPVAAAVRRSLRRHALPVLGASAIALAASSPPALAQQQGETLDEITVVADRLGLLEDRVTDSVFGVSRSLVETPRAVSIVSETTIERYSIETIDDFVTTTPGTYGGSFFGVPGAISVRGRRGENYFRGFKRITNNGFFPLPVGASSRVEIIRGPAPVLYGAGRVGGLLNFYPKTVVSDRLTADDGISGYIEYTTGSYSKNLLAGQLNAPFLLGGRETGLSLYAEYEDSKSFYRGREPLQKLLQASFNHELPNDWRMELGGMYFSSDGFNQTPGWNRLTQELIDSGTYITGRNTFVQDLDGTGNLSRSDFDAAVGTFFGVSNITQYLEFFFGLPGGGAAFALDDGVGTTRLSRRNVVLSAQDIWESEGTLVYFDLIRDFANDSTLKFQLFYDSQDADGSLTTGFAAIHEMDVFEARLSYGQLFDLSDNASVEVHGALFHREYNSTLYENFLQGYLVLDRLDLSRGASEFDIVATPFNNPNTPWEAIFDSTWRTTAAALVTDFRVGDFGLLLNGRYDRYSASSIDTGSFGFSNSLRNTYFTGNDDDFSWSASLSWFSPFGVVPYVTFAEGSELRVNSNGGVSPGPVRDEDLLADSDLAEVGIKFSLLDDTLFGALTWYRQTLSRTDAFGNKDQERSRGVEAEVSYVITDNWALTGAATMLNVRIQDPDPTNCASGSGRGEFLNLPPRFFGIDGADGYGGIFAALNASCIPELQGGYKRSTVPEDVFSLFVTYTSDPTAYGTFGATFGATHVSSTSTLIGDVRFPSHNLFRLALFAEFDRVSLIGTVDNVFDETYFRPVQGVFQNVAAIPGEGRIWRLKARVRF